MSELFTENSNESMFTAEKNPDMDLSSFLKKSTDTSDDTKKSVDETNPLQKELEYQKNRQLGMSITWNLMMVFLKNRLNSILKMMNA